jgi:hypothetical protein
MIEGLEFEKCSKTLTCIKFHEMIIGRILSNFSPHGTTVRMDENFPQFDYSTRCEITRASWEQAKLIDITARLTK